MIFKLNRAKRLIIEENNKNMSDNIDLTDMALSLESMINKLKEYQK